MLDARLTELEVPRQLHGAWALALAGAAHGDAALTALARQGRDACRARLPSPGLVEDAFLLVTALALGEVTGVECATAARLWAAIDAHGRIGWDPTPPTGTAAAIELAQRVRDGRLDYEPPQVLLALAHATAAGATSIDHALARALRACMHRFRGRRLGPGVVAAHGARGLVPGDGRSDAGRPRVRDHRLGAHPPAGHDRRLHQRRAARWPGLLDRRLPRGRRRRAGARRRGRRRRADRRHRAAAARAVDFLDVLTYQDRDCPFLPAPGRAIGGVRQSRTAGDVRTDFVQHALIALVTLAPNVG